MRIQKRRKKRDSVSLIGRRNFPRLLVVARLRNFADCPAHVFSQQGSRSDADAKVKIDSILTRTPKTTLEAERFFFSDGGAMHSRYEGNI